MAKSSMAESVGKLCSLSFAMRHGDSMDPANYLDGFYVIETRNDDCNTGAAVDT